MHPLSTYEAHRQDQVALLRRSTQQHVREHDGRPRDDAHGRPPDPTPSRVGDRAVAARPRWAPTT
ncbi:hypothetical protein [Cellulomonas sp. S1-8]|uniref:hypothetical protein n=1 Tax=Cellulomonas sp. S1-8 TaxID=2904790 RepID=UPI0022442F08|nr:hypothetical protein [Cellulomonas sp. S1-8]UZN04705.1 hypothetical protein OKX07_07305 [Cellulomonas sp. S1-8]